MSAAADCQCPSSDVRLSVDRMTAVSFNEDGILLSQFTIGYSIGGSGWGVLRKCAVKSDLGELSRYRPNY